MFRKYIEGFPADLDSLPSIVGLALRERYDLHGALFQPS